MTRRRALLSSALVCALLLAVVFHTRILFATGAMLVNSDPPQHADAALVLGGDYRGLRLLKAAELEREGYVPRVLVSGAGEMYGFHEADLAIEFAVRNGYPRGAFIPLKHPAVSTEDEVRGVAPDLHALGIHKLLLVTSPSHTGRATRVAHRFLPDLEIHPVASDDPDWDGGYWWRTREGRKGWFMEILKNIAYTFGI